MRPRGIPVVMYHSVSRDRPDWIWNVLITPVEVFEGQMRALKERGWTAISLDLLHSHMATGAPVPEKSVVLTFDDGYLDNWLYAYPILKKYGHHAVVWMTTDFADPRTDPRPTLEDVWSGKVAETALDPRGFLSWAEMREMERDGLMEIQSHAKTHTWYFSGPKIVDFHRPEGMEGYQFPPWLAWNRFPEKKYRSLISRMDDQFPYGTPIYEHERSVVVRRYFEDPAVAARLIKMVGAGGGRAFFQEQDWRQRLMDAAKDRARTGERYETDDEYLQRVRLELTESRENIETNLGSPVRFLCWPGGGFNERTLEIAKAVGYLATTTHYEDPDRPNTVGQNPSEINRIGSGSPSWCRGRFLRRTDPEYFLAILGYFAGEPNSTWKVRRFKLQYLMRCFLGKNI
jgi:peptidoglycan/xylan/chitin deacetylase (PgdA/CDA1 family)